MTEASKDLVVTRVIDAPVERVWQAWTDAGQIKRWWGPAGFSAPVAEVDFRVGGSTLVGMSPPGGPVMHSTWTYTEIVPNERIEFVFSHADADGAKIDPQEAGLPPGVPQDVRHVVTFEPAGQGRTRMTITEYGYTSAEVLELSKLGQEQVVDKLAAVCTK